MTFPVRTQEKHANSAVRNLPGLKTSTLRSCPPHVRVVSRPLVLLQFRIPDQSQIGGNQLSDATKLSTHVYSTRPTTTRRYGTTFRHISLPLWFVFVRFVLFFCARNDDRQNHKKRNFFMQCYNTK